MAADETQGADEEVLAEIARLEGVNALMRRKIEGSLRVLLEPVGSLPEDLPDAQQEIMRLRDELQAVRVSERSAAEVTACENFLREQEASSRIRRARWATDHESATVGAVSAVAEGVATLDEMINSAKETLRSGDQVEQEQQEEEELNFSLRSELEDMLEYRLMRDKLSKASMPEPEPEQEPLRSAPLPPALRGAAEQRPRRTADIPKLHTNPAEARPAHGPGQLLERLHTASTEAGDRLRIADDMQLEPRSIAVIQARPPL